MNLDAPAVVIVHYDPKWPALYEQERKLILKVLGSRVDGIEHIGSTAVQNLGSKNIIDIMAGASNIGKANECLPLLEKIGYFDVIPESDTIDWYYCLGKNDQGQAYHLHLVRFESEHWKKHIIFRDFLRKNPQVSQQYYNLKKELAAKYGSDRLGYTEAKSAFIEPLIAKAKQV
jgi:GrpB-like predicted nucleotidyltransferase (UPF0157 family)